MLEIMLMNCRLGVFLEGSQTSEHGFTEHASVRMPSVLLAKIGFLDQPINLCLVLNLAVRDLFANFFDPQLVDQKIDSGSGAIPTENAHIFFISITNSFDYLSGFLTRMVRLLSCSRLETVRVCIKWHDLLLDIALNEPQAFPRSRVISINKRFFTIHSLYYSII